MSIRVKVQSRANPQHREDPPKYYLVPTLRDETTLEELSEIVSRYTSLGLGDVFSVLKTTVQIMPMMLVDGKIVHLGALGSFYLNVKSIAVDTPEEATADKVQYAYIVFRPTKALKEQVRHPHIIMVNE